MKIAKLGVALSFSALGLFASGCGDDSGSGGTGVDASDGVDAGDPVDAGPDIDADTRPTMGACSIVVAPPFQWDFETFGDPDLSGNNVVFHGPDGTLLGATTTNAAGVATFDSCIRDTMITAFFFAPEAATGGGPGSGGIPFVGTFAGVTPEDTVYWGSNTFDVPDPSYSGVNATFDQDVTVFGADFELEDVDYVELRIAMPGPIGCNPSVTTSSIDGTAFLPIPLCAIQADGTIDLVATAYNEGPIGSAFLNDVPVVFGHEFEPGDTAVTLPAWTAGFPQNAVTLTNPPPSAIQTRGAAFHRVDGVTFDLYGGRDTDLAWRTDPESGNPPPIVMSETYDNGMPDGFANGTEARGLAVFDRPSVDCCPTFDLDQRWTEMTVSGPFTDSAEIEMFHALPRLSGLLFSLPEPNRPQLSWLADGPLDGADGAFMGFAIVGDSPEDFLGLWVVATHTAEDGTILLPQLDAALVEDLLPPGFHVVPLFGSVWSSDYQSYGDLITTEGFEFLNFATIPGRPNGGLPLPIPNVFGQTFWPLNDRALPARPPIDAVGTARRTGFTDFTFFLTFDP